MNTNIKSAIKDEHKPTKKIFNRGIGHLETRFSHKKPRPWDIRIRWTWTEYPIFCKTL